MEDNNISIGIQQPAAVSGVSDRSRRRPDENAQKKKKQQEKKQPLLAKADEVCVAGLDETATIPYHPPKEDKNDTGEHIDIKV